MMGSWVHHGLLHEHVVCTTTLRRVAYLISHRDVIAGPEAATKELHPHDGEDQEEQSHHNGDIGHGCQ